MVFDQSLVLIVLVATRFRVRGFKPAKLAYSLNRSEREVWCVNLEADLLHEAQVEGQELDLPFGAGQPARRQAE